MSATYPRSTAKYLQTEHTTDVQVEQFIDPVNPRQVDFAIIPTKSTPSSTYVSPYATLPQRTQSFAQAPNLHLPTMSTSTPSTTDGSIYFNPRPRQYTLTKVSLSEKSLSQVSHSSAH